MIETIKIPELGIEVEIAVHDKGKSFSEIKIPEGWRLLSICRKKDMMNEVVWLANSKYSSILNMDCSSAKDDFFIEQPFNKRRKKNKEKEYIARFSADSGGSGFDCYWDLLLSSSVIGVRFCRDLKGAD